MRQAGWRSGRLLTTWLPVALVLGLLASGFAVYRWDLDERWFGASSSSTPPDPGTEPAAVPPPAGVTLPAPTAPAAVASPGADVGRPAPRKLARLLDPLLADPDLGANVVAAVADLSTGRLVYSKGAKARPASTTKLLTALAALHVLGPDHRFVTRVVLDGTGKQRRLVLVGGGDPYLAGKPAPPDEPVYPHRADLRTLARKTAEALTASGVSATRLAYDDSLFTGPDASPQWEPSYVPTGVVSRIRALWADEGRPESGSGRVSDPSLTAATYFARELRAAGVLVRGPLARRVAGDGAEPVAEVESAPLSEIVERMLTVSDNEAAEVLAHQVGLAAVGEGSFAGGVRGVRQALTELGVPVGPDDVWYDGSGLSRADVLTPGLLLGVLRAAAAADRPDLRAVLAGLPVAGFTGSLEYRFESTPPDARGHVRAKTGTLRGTRSLAGIATDLDGTTVAFVLMADRVRFARSTVAQEALDAAAAAIGGCHCSVGAGR
ncbi:D-alanyl-D-alanine carboxypeptidase/D-alanyl-D-alanine-endopeptidase [Nocardioides agariphilus]|uniref:D-alanyl-D-alanine carboxypeptidase/D-alanyl-D-alanine-endopeptidase n=1 Tax=Nocardioides agariphilus TaxID=433664 RepID=A0A930YPY2_9ACTN|nr:D-alanyl-D-alanine carboxypeptidase/D-alanyl-D-alanine-endopeptidase [Nocardioides agariphilus]MBF4768165.1 D-alanyl-D-alanine carboxypeptidase/D-alanyl-D-alanine-endopeptidase [Nocardioides agariphilus]